MSGSQKGIKEAIGTARITFSEKMTPEDAELNLTRQGALTVEELKELSDHNNNIHAIAFDNFSLFPKRVSYGVLKSKGCISDANLVTAEFLSFDKLNTILNHAFCETKQ